MSREDYLTTPIMDVYQDLSEKQQLHLIDALVEEGWISPKQAGELKRLEDILDGSGKKSSDSLSNENNNTGFIGKKNSGRA